ncbi:YggT family protein [Photobacterium nomapromontoriensis]|uniref:YggT family protein n=1 Tax=Photobacterium nomapromontoriensis TaxID=2910237 RepID=UPI003D137AF5
MTPLDFLVSTLFQLYTTVVLLRIWLQWAKADFYNPFSQFIVKATQPIVGPLRRIIPSIGSLDMATLVFAYVLCLAKISLILYLGNYALDTQIFWLAVLSLVKAAGSLVFWVLLLRAILSWVSQGRSPVEYVMHQLTEPMTAPIRRVIPAMGGLDLSVLVLFLCLQFANVVMANYMPGWTLAFL